MRRGFHDAGVVLLLKLGLRHRDVDGPLLASVRRVPRRLLARRRLGLRDFDALGEGVVCGCGGGFESLGGGGDGGGGGLLRPASGGGGGRFVAVFLQV